MSESLKREDWIELDPDVDRQFIAALGEEKLAELENRTETVTCMECGRIVFTEDADMWCPCGGGWSHTVTVTPAPSGMIHGTTD